MFFPLVFENKLTLGHNLKKKNMVNISRNTGFKINIYEINVEVYLVVLQQYLVQIPVFSVYICSCIQDLSIEGFTQYII